MAIGVPVGRQWVLVLHNGDVVIDWGDGILQDVYTGNFFEADNKEFSRHLLPDTLLAQLKQSGIVEDYNNTTIFFASLPERPHRTLR